MIRHLRHRLRIAAWGYALGVVLVLGNFGVAWLFHREPAPTVVLGVCGFVLGFGIAVLVKP